MPTAATSSTTLKQRIIDAATALGAQKVGFAHAVEVDSDAVDAYNQWLNNGMNGEMTYLANYPDIRRQPRMLLAGDNHVDNADNDDDGDHHRAATVIVFAFSYYHTERQAPEAAQFAMYAHGSDYHEVLRKKLQPIVALLNPEECRICVDSAPLRERYWAMKAGVGFIGRNNQLIVPGMGSYFFLAEIVTTAAIEADAPCTESCLQCGRCVSACPGGALCSEQQFDARRCLSYLTIEHRGPLPTAAFANDADFAAALGQRVYGCDECQRVCPHNSCPPETIIDEFRLRPALRNITHSDIMEMTQETFSATFSHSAVKRCKLAGLKRNAAFFTSPTVGQND
jgi:epoxyqueuosine reductase